MRTAVALALFNAASRLLPEGEEQTHPLLVGGSFELRACR
jgi:hypothetical protein